MSRELTKKQRGFIMDVIKTGNATEAAKNNYKIKSKNKDNVAGAIGSENLRKPKIQAEIKPFVDKLIIERERIISAMAKKKLTKVQYENLGRTLDIFTKNIQLLSGGVTERYLLVGDDQYKKILKLATSKNE